MLSVITPVFNGVRFMESCILNVIEQLRPGVEHVVVDGGSTDGTVDVIRRYAANHSHIRWISERDRGQSDAMNKGLGMAAGSVVSFLNVDDFYEPGTLSAAIALFERLPDPSLLVGNCNVWDDDGKLLFVSRPFRMSYENLLSGRFMEAFPMNPAAYFYHASLHRKIGLYDLDEHYAMDVEFILKAVQAANVVYLDRTFGNYRYLRGTKTYEQDQNGETQRVVRQVVYRHLKQLPLLRRLKLMLRYEWPRNRCLRRVKVVAARLLTGNGG
ncbi:glycosyltransferase family 2 protein [Citrifermentans bremense]|uniref:glycosyltransferase family 2 protein n=1 Tax=Citrifermentans bremense TaxID=60035 RepID=UPI000401187C|nr:glycosyltransferase family 2 protein [Citrifermentans bremense]